jgi:hypothetical protein
MRQAYKRGVALVKGRRAERSIEIVNRSTGQPVVVLKKDYYTGAIHGERVRGYGMSRNPRRRNKSRAQRQARHYKLAQRRGRLGFLRRLKGRANARGRNPYYRTADGVIYRSEPASRQTQRMLGWRRMSKKELQRYIQKWEAGVPMSPFYRPPSMRRHYGSWR